MYCFSGLLGTFVDVAWSRAFWFLGISCLLLLGLDCVVRLLVNSVGDFVSLCCIGFTLVVGCLGFVLG